MGRESPPTRRVIALLDAVVASPERGWSLADLAKQTGLAKATCLGILNELCASGYLSRGGEGRAYRPGPRLLALGAAAEQSFASLELARPVLARLAAATGAPCTASTIADDAITVLARVGGEASVAPAITVGSRSAFGPPSGVMFVAWEDDASVEAWLARSPVFPVQLDHDALRREIASCRTRGFFLEGLSDYSAALYSVLAELDDEHVRARLYHLVRGDLDPVGQGYIYDDVKSGRTYDVSLILAPVYNRDAKVEFILAVLLMRTGLTAAELKALIAALLGACAEVTTALGGRDPWTSPAAQVAP